MFDKMANEEVTDFIEECLYEKEVKNCELPDLLTKEVKSRWKGYQDDITTIVVLNMTSLRKNSFYHIDK